MIWKQKKQKNDIRKGRGDGHKARDVLDIQPPSMLGQPPWVPVLFNLLALNQPGEGAKRSILQSNSRSCSLMLTRNAKEPV